MFRIVRAMIAAMRLTVQEFSGNLGGARWSASKTGYAEPSSGIVPIPSGSTTHVQANTATITIGIITAGPKPFALKSTCYAAVPSGSPQFSSSRQVSRKKLTNANSDHRIQWLAGKRPGRGLDGRPSHPGHLARRRYPRTRTDSQTGDPGTSRLDHPGRRLHGR